MQEIKNFLDRLFHLKWRLTFKLGQSITGSYRGVKKQNTPIWNLSILKFYWMPLKVNEAIICGTMMAASVSQWSAKLAKGIKHPRKACCKPHSQLPWNNSKSWAGICLFPICLTRHQSHLPANRQRQEWRHNSILWLSNILFQNKCATFPICKQWRLIRKQFH